MSNEPITPAFFPTPGELRAWLEEHHASAQELVVGLYKVGSGRPSITWPQSVDEALCFGWIDGMRKRLDDASYAIRFTPRKPGSSWSAANVARVKELASQGRMRPAGLRAFEARAEERTGIYGYEREDAALDAADEEQFRGNTQAWAFFQGQAASYRRAAIWWVVSAKKDETRRKRLATLIEDSERGRTIAPLTRRPRSG